MPSTWTTGQTYSTDDVIPLKIASISDIHLGHRQTMTSSTASGLYKVFKDDGELSTWDILAIPGDLIDRLLNLTDPSIAEIMALLAYILRKCAKHNIVILLLRGTPGHDHNQPELMLEVAKMLDEPVKIYYSDTLSIKYIEEYGINVLFVPDEWDIDAYSTYEQTLALLREKGLTQVDYCLFHGAFNYQIDASLNPKAHNEDLWSKLVKYYIFAGHVHYKSQYKNILVAGSFDRLAHNEEEPKGYLTCQVLPSGDTKILFHENTLATIYKTLDVRGKTLEDIFEMLDDVCLNNPEYSHFRLHANKGDSIITGLKRVKEKYGHFIWNLKVDDNTKEERKKTLKLVVSEYKPIDLSKTTIQTILSERLDKLGADKEAVLSILAKYL